MIKDRVIQVVESKGIKKEDFFSKIGMTSANFRGNAKNTPLNSNAIENILSEFSDVNPEWLLTGKGPMLKKQEHNAVNQSIVGDNNIQAGSNSSVDNRQYYSDSPDILRAQIDEKDRLLAEKEIRIKEKDAQIKEKDAQIKEKDAQIKEKDAQINKLLSVLSNK